MRIGYLGAGAWGFALANLLASKGHDVLCWTIFPDLIEKIEKTSEHPMLPGSKSSSRLKFTLNLEEILDSADLLVESVTSAGMRPVFSQIKQIATPSCPIVITSKGIEQGTGLILSDVIVDLLGENVRQQIGAISGPSYASEVVLGLPTSVTGSAYSSEVMYQLCETFTTDKFRVYPNSDMRGVAYGGALKNVIAIACGICEGLGLGYSARAALMTRGLHEICKLAEAQGCRRETLYGLSGMGDLCVTCSALTSRNFKFGYLLAQGKQAQEAQKEIGMVVEGAYTCISAHELSQKLAIPMPITETIYKILQEGLSPQEAVKQLMQRTIKDEHL